MLLAGYCCEMILLCLQVYDTSSRARGQCRAFPLVCVPMRNWQVTTFCGIPAFDAKVVYMLTQSCSTPFPKLAQHEAVGLRYPNSRRRA